MNDLTINDADLCTNPAERIPTCLCLDLSPSMEGNNALDELNDAVRKFYGEVQQHPMTKNAVEIAVVGFCQTAETIQDFGPVATATIPQLRILGGGTSLGNGVSRSLDLLAARKAEYQKAGVSYNQPWLVIITDGQPTDQSHVPLASQISALVTSKRLTVFPILVGGHASEVDLALLSPLRKPLRLRGLNFEGLFEFLGKSLAAVSASRSGAVKLDTSSMHSWAEI